ncbi:MAG: methylated-DNA-[protein]-cysteine S-methyltransferase [Thermoleophilaceae bacterium]|jgi:methylated-DNA-[protein]-cysteine S-methyltransferase|nr:methylated-DNA-[protein]-cysteine S-methyltransferase [Thermoleophilaceae bacterium]
MRSPPASWTVFESPIGPLTLRGGAGRLTGLSFPGHVGRLGEAARDPAAFAEPLRQLAEYFDGRRQGFDLELVLDGTAFERAVWHELTTIPYGATTSYGRLAEAIGCADRVRDVAAAIGRTPIPIVVPCHRVVGADGSLTGYGGGLERKRALLDLEAGQLALV